MSHVVVVGAQWGDEGKGKIVDWLSERADVVVRFQGGHNAGHTLSVHGQTYKLSLLPSGVVRGKQSFVGNGVVIDPWALLEEIERVGKQGIPVTPDVLTIAENASLILPLHGDLDRAREEASGTNRIGTTGRGIGPAYEDKIGRRAIRVCDLENEDVLHERIERLLSHHKALHAGYGLKAPDPQALFDRLREITPRILPFAGPVWRHLADADRNGKKILYEGAQGFMLDVDHGTYPFVTSSNTVAGHAAAGSGVRTTNYVLGITKAYTTRVGSGPFPTEQDNETGRLLGERGHEFGTVTHRPRRCGWFDAVLVRQAVQTGGIDGIALTKLDVLDGFRELKVCVGYRHDNRDYDYLPANRSVQSGVEPVYETLAGWSESTHRVRERHKLPLNADRYVRRIEELVGVPVTLLSTSPDRDDTILIQDPFSD